MTATKVEQGKKVSDDLEVAQLRQRIDSLEQELLEVRTQTNAIVAAAQDRVYWLDRWRIDLNRVMETRGGKLFRGGMELLGKARHRARKIKNSF